MISRNTNVFLNLSFCIITCLLSIMDSINTYEYILYADKSTNFIKLIIPIMFILHPISLFLYYSICLIYLHYLEDIDFKNILLEKEFYEMIYFREKVKTYSILIFPIAIWLTFTTQNSLAFTL